MDQERLGRVRELLERVQAELEAMDMTLELRGGIQALEDMIGGVPATLYLTDVAAISVGSGISFNPGTNGWSMGGSITTNFTPLEIAEYIVTNRPDLMILIAFEMILTKGADSNRRQRRPNEEL